jgi:hypothetical protein
LTVEAVPPKLTEVDPIVTLELAKLALGTAANPKVRVSLPALALIVKPCPEEEAKFKLPEGESANKFVPLNEAVAKELCLVIVAFVTYPASLFSWEILLPDTIIFFQVAMLFYKNVVLLYI